MDKDPPKPKLNIRTVNIYTHVHTYITVNLIPKTNLLAGGVISSNYLWPKKAQTVSPGLIEVAKLPYLSSWLKSHLAGTMAKSCGPSWDTELSNPFKKIRSRVKKSSKDRNDRKTSRLSKTHTIPPNVNMNHGNGSRFRSICVWVYIKSMHKDRVQAPLVGTRFREAGRLSELL